MTRSFLRSSLLRFLLVGCCSTLLDFVIYMVLFPLLPITLAKGMSMACSSVFSYVANKVFTFGDKGKTCFAYIVRFYIVFIANMLANIGTNYLIYKLSGSKVLAFVLATGCGMTVNYIGQKFFVFHYFDADEVKNV